MNEAACIVGIDVAKLKLDVALLNEGKLKSKVFSNAPEGFRELNTWLIAKGAQPESSHLCMEATGPYSETVATFLSEAGWPVSVVNPARVKGFAQGELARNKTDRADAALLARFCAAMHPGSVDSAGGRVAGAAGLGRQTASLEGHAPAGVKPDRGVPGQRSSRIDERCTTAYRLVVRANQASAK